MKKDDMIRKILRRLESDFFKVNRSEVDRELKAECRRLNEKTYSEVEKLYYTIA